MYARIGRGRFRPEHGAAVPQLAQERLETYRQARGFRSVTYLDDRASGWGFAISQWATQAAAEAGMALLRPTAARFATYAANATQATPDVTGPLPVFEVVAAA